MKKSIIVTGLDIGSSKISAVMAEAGADGGFNILAQATEPARGMSRGAVADLGGVTGAVSRAFLKLGKKSPRRIENIYVNISGQSVKGQTARGMVPLALRGREVTVADMERCINVASTINLPVDREIIHRVVQFFSIDDQPPIKNPLGLAAARLTCEVYIITASINNIQNIYQAVDNAGYDVREAVFSGLADGAAMLDKDELAKNVVLVNIGDGITELSLFSKGVLNSAEVIPAGAKDISGAFRDDPKFDDILSKVRAASADSIILSGGMAFTDGVLEYIEEKVSLPSRMGMAHDVRGDVSQVDSMRLATAIGLARYGYDRLKAKAVGGRNLFERASNRLVDIFNNYF